MPASSAPQRSQYHSVGRFKVPHSLHLSVLATPAAPGLAGACVVAASPERPAEPEPGLLRREAGAETGCGAGFFSSSGAADVRKAISSTGGGPCVISGSRAGERGAGRAAAAGGANGSGG